jgi:hypothetical protein
MRQDKKISTTNVGNAHLVTKLDFDETQSTELSPPKYGDFFSANSKKPDKPRGDQ